MQIIKLANAIMVVQHIAAVVKINQPATLHTDEIPCIQVSFVNAPPLLIPYETIEERDNEYDEVDKVLAQLYS